MDDWFLNSIRSRRKMKMYIFSFLPQKSRQMIRGVCREWKQMVDEMPCAVINNENYEATTQLTDLYIVKVQNFSRELQTAVKFKTTIRRLEFWDVVVSYNLFRLLQECPGVQELIFMNVTLDSHKKLKCPEGLTLPEVKVIRFYAKCYLKFAVHELILFDMLSQIEFGKLEEVLIPERFHWSNFDSNTESIERSYPTKTEQPYGVSSAGLVGFLLENRKTVKKFNSHKEFRPFEGSHEEFVDQIYQLKIEEMQCGICGVGGCQVIEHLTNLKEIDILAWYDCWPALGTAIQASSSTLTKIDFYFSPLQLEQRHGHPQDASVFKDCSKLKSLYMDTGGNAFRNLALLPDGIQLLTLMGHFNPEGLLAISSKLRNLRVVELHQYGVMNIEEIMFFNNEIIEGFLGTETLVRLLAVGFRGNAEDIGIVSKSNNAFKFFVEFYGDSSMMTLEILTSREWLFPTSHDIARFLLICTSIN